MTPSSFLSPEWQESILKRLGVDSVDSLEPWIVVVHRPGEEEVFNEASEEAARTKCVDLLGPAIAAGEDAAAVIVKCRPGWWYIDTITTRQFKSATA